MANTKIFPRGPNPPSSTPPRCNKRDDNDNVGSKQKRKKTNKDDAKSKKALNDTASKTGTLTLDLTEPDANNNVATHTADPNNSGNACPDKQLQKGQSTKTTEEKNESNASSSETMQEDNIATTVFGSMVSKKNNIFNFGKYCLY
jgi:hypothetical protein